MKLTFNPTTKVQSVVLDDDDRIIQNSSGNKVYLYGIPGGWEIKATFTRRDNVQIGLIGGTYDLDPNDEYCYIIPIPSKATELDKGLGVSILLYEPSGTTFIRHSTIATSMYVYSSNNVIIPDDLDTVLYDALNLAISNLTTNKYEYDAIVGGTGETLSKDTPVYSKAKIDELDVVIVSNINTHKARTDNPHSVTKTQVGLGNADNTSDADKPVSTAQQAALNQKENLSNKRTSWQATPTNTAYPSEKLTKDSLDLKVDKATTILGIDLANDIARAEFVAALGNATALLSGLLSPEDYSLLVTLRAMLGEEADVDTFVNKFNEILAIFSNYPEGADLVTALAGKVDKVAGKELSSNDYTDAEQAKVSHIPDNFNTFMGDYYTKAQVDTLLDQLTTAYGLTETAIEELAHNGTILLSSLTTYDYITLYLKHTDTHFIFDGKLIDPAVFVNNGDFIQLNAWEDNVQKTYGKLTYIGSMEYLIFTGANASDTLVIKGYKKDAVTGLLVEESFTGTNHLDAKTNVHDSLVELDTQIKANADSVTDLEDGTTIAKKAEQDADGNVIADTYATKTEAQALELNIALHEQRIDETEETLRKALNNDVTATADDDGTGIIAMGKDVAPAPLKVQVDGLLLDAPQLVTNAGFDTNYTGWTAVAGTNAWLTGGYLQNTANGTSNVSYIYQSVFNLTDKYYSIARARVTNEVSTGIQIRHGGTVITTQSTPAINTWYLLSGVFIPTNDTLRIYHTYSDSATANGKVMEADYVYTFNISTLISNKQYSPLYSKTFGTMSDAEIKAQMDLWVTNGTLPHDGIQAVNMNKRIRATGKNIINSDFAIGGFNITTGAETTELNRARVTEFTRIKPSTAYAYATNSTIRVRTLWFYDVNKNFLGYTTVVTTSGTFTSSASAFYVKFNFNRATDTENITQSDLDSLKTGFQLELGSTATTYEAYKHSDLYLQANAEGYQVPNGTKDTIEIRDGKAYYVKRTAIRVVETTDITEYNTSLTNVDRITIPKTALAGMITTTGDVQYYEYVENFSREVVAVSGTYDSTTYIGYHAMGSSSLYLIVAKGTYANLAAAQAALEGMSIIYLLATPITTEIKSSGILNGYARGQVLIDDMIKDQDIYTTNIAVTNTSRPIIALGEILKMNNDLSTTSLAVSGATIAGDGLSFTHTGLTAGDIVVFTYYDGDGIKGLTTVTYYDEKTVVVDSVTAKVYKITPAIASGVLSWTLTEI